MITLQVPASTANLGAGFDCLGIALNLYNRLQVEEWDGCLIESQNPAVPTGEDNLIYTTMARFYAEAGRPFKGAHIRQADAIYQSRGLGSSSACIVGGIVAANALLGGVADTEQMLQLATKIEGHPDNVAPALLGGLVVSAMEGERIYYVRQHVSQKLSFLALVPDFELKTAMARSVLPEQYTKQQAVYNLSRSALMAASLCSGKLENLQVAAGDMLHQPYRMGLIPGASKLFALGQSLGIAVFISGAGPTIMMMGEGALPLQQITGVMKMDQEMARFEPVLLQADNFGCRQLEEN